MKAWELDDNGAEIETDDRSVRFDSKLLYICEIRCSETSTWYNGYDKHLFYGDTPEQALGFFEAHFKGQPFEIFEAQDLIHQTNESLAIMNGGQFQLF